MSAPTFPEDPVTQRPALQSADFRLTVRQNPERARVAGGKEKERKPVDPPPIIQLKIDEVKDPGQNYLQSPFYFMCCTLYNATEDRPATTAQSTALAGTLVSSLHRLKDTDNLEGGFFVFGDLSVKIEGEFRLKFNLFEMREVKRCGGARDEVVYIKSILSKPFTVSPPKNFPGMAESTWLSRSFADQGVKLRIRKEARTLMKRSLTRAEPDYPAPLAQPRSPERSGVTGQQMGANYQTSRDYPYYNGPDAKRPRSSVDMSGRGLYDGDARYGRQIDPYQPHATNPYQSQTYQQGMMQGYPAAAGVSDYPIRQAQQGSTPTPFGSADESMASIRSPGTSGYMGQPRYQSYSGAQMPYNIASSSQMPQMGESTPSRAGQAANMGGMVSGSAGMGMMPQAYQRSAYQPPGSTILPPLQSNRQVVPSNSNGNPRGYYDPSIQETPAILPSQPGPSTNGDRYGGEGQAAFDAPGTPANSTPQ
ncbi:hypothetical protein ACJ72_01247 [Emergomyces africanus]|uniref:Velvet domain-containing protein n=1 Tax=Emergomyces africanus TaxID=1955775 RepID=A0A1B7P5S6_9EURO|nr:hypothetical protein ACJ72_01238 [Emergomyces africanus]OAX84393.1 hypothetical protein ACJ72_01247 [Emergomyces africanus]